MNEQVDTTRNGSPAARRGTVVRAANYLLTGDGKGSRSTRLAGTVIDRVLEQEGGKVTGRVVMAVLVVLGVAGLAFVAYRLLVLDLILTLVRERG
ncbi:hypothetical protein AWW66_14210 [Micromonospora rosaria]|uniref:Uncharacterized protein n=1 Tax=Micromonospora rosaria TaxID=47874 RepID=A0A136PS68_9ACTN|nr:hypothetical protein [Micromonospora rosaria]KXK61293.1 hypothetical protein AWW66_14210 [Micromonospora rosaria]